MLVMNLFDVFRRFAMLHTLSPRLKRRKISLRFGYDTGIAAVCSVLNPEPRPVGSPAFSIQYLNQVPFVRHLPEDGNEREGFLTPAQFKKLLPFIPPDLQDFVEWGYATGQRRGETTLMTWEMLDRKDNVLRIPGWICKNKKGRTLPLDTKLAAIIERRKKAARQVETDGTVRLSEYIFHRGMASQSAILGSLGKRRARRQAWQARSTTICAGRR
jgi:integrase